MQDGKDTAVNRLGSVVVTLAALGIFALSINIIPAVVLRAGTDLGMAPEWLINVSAVQFAGLIVAAVAGGAAADRFGYKMSLGFACITMLLGSAVWTQAESLPMVLLGSLLLGLGGGALESQCTSLVCELYRDRRRLMINLSQLTFCVGAAGAPFLVSQVLPEGRSWRLPFYWLIGSFLLLAAGFFAVRLPGAPKPGSKAKFRLDRPGLRNMLLPCSLLFLYVFSEAGVATFVNLHLAQHRGAPEFWALAGQSAFWGAMGLGRILCALTPESFPQHRLIGLIFLSSGLALALQAFVESWQGSLILFALTGFCLSGLWALIVAVAAAYDLTGSATAIGITIACGALGCIAAPPVMSVLIWGVGGKWAFVLISLPLLLGAWMSFRYIRR